MTSKHRLITSEKAAQLRKKAFGESIVKPPNCGANGITRAWANCLSGFIIIGSMANQHAQQITLEEILIFLLYLSHLAEE